MWQQSTRCGNSLPDVETVESRLPYPFLELFSAIFSHSYKEKWEIATEWEELLCLFGCFLVWLLVGWVLVVAYFGWFGVSP